jgi:hypothetical protein
LWLAMFKTKLSLSIFLVNRLIGFLSICLYFNYLILLIVFVKLI